KRQVQKIMRTIVLRLREKITALESFQRVAPLDVELLGELRTFEINNNYDKVTSKGLALKAAVVEEREESNDDEGPLADDSELKEALALIARNYGKMSQRLYKNKFAGKKGNNFNKNVVQDKKTSMPLLKSDSQRVEKDQCRECRGFGHFQYMCANLKEKNKSLKATWEDSDEEGTDEPSLHTSNLAVHTSVKKLMCLTTSHAPTKFEESLKETKASEDEANQNVCVDPVHLLAMEKCAQASEALQKLQNEVFRLSRANRVLNEHASASTATTDRLFSTQQLLAERNQEIILLKNEAVRLMNGHASMESKLKTNFAELNRTVEVIQKLNKGKAYLNKLLSLGRQHGDLTGIGYTGREDIPVSSTGTSNTKHTGLAFGDKLGVGGMNLHGRPSKNVFDRFVKSTVSNPLSPPSPLKVHSPMQKSVNKITIILFLSVITV
ncbi:Unknown protein, partial [Striga hermonthica]